MEGGRQRINKARIKGEKERKRTKEERKRMKEKKEGRRKGKIGNENYSDNFEKPQLSMSIFCKIFSQIFFRSRLWLLYKKGIKFINMDMI